MNKNVNDQRNSKESFDERIGSWNNGRFGSPDYECETLYGAAGRYYIHFDGGPMAKYSEQFGSYWGSGGIMKCITETEAKCWVKKYMSDEKYEAIWGPVND